MWYIKGKNKGQPTFLREAETGNPIGFATRNDAESVGRNLRKKKGVSDLNLFKI